jgi:predicted nucleic acid-binding protein
MASALIDTNILIYAREALQPAKRRRAIDLIDRLGARGELFLTAQALNEFSAASLRRGTPIGEVRAAVTRWTDLARVLPLEAAATTAALEAVERHHLSFWDALIWATAREANVGTVVSEDFQHGREIEGVRFESRHEVGGSMRDHLTIAVGRSGANHCALSRRLHGKLESTAIVRQADGQQPNPSLARLS